MGGCGEGKSTGGVALGGVAGEGESGAALRRAIPVAGVVAWA